MASTQFGQGKPDRVESALTQLEDMMKKQAKTLKLAKETVRMLSRVELGQVAGGMTSSSQFWSDPQFSCQQELAPDTYPCE